MYRKRLFKNDIIVIWSIQKFMHTIKLVWTEQLLLEFKITHKLYRTVLDSRRHTMH